jgi:carbon storage regulator
MMLVLSRRMNEDIFIGPDIRIRIIKIGVEEVKLGIDAPRDQKILRGELANNETDPGSRTEGV